MTSDFLRQAAADIPSLQGVFITAMPDCLLYASWLREGSTWQEEQVATYYGDLFRANREGVETLDAWSEGIQVTVEARDHLIVLQEATADFVCAFVFERRTTSLGLVRLLARKLLERIRPSLS